MGIDYGLKRTGISVTDPLRIIVQGLETQKTEQLMDFITAYAQKELIDEFVVGYPFPEGQWGDPKFKAGLDAFLTRLRNLFPEKKVNLFDERFSSLKAKEIIMESGIKKKKRKRKELTDRTSAIIILQEYLGHI